MPQAQALITVFIPAYNAAPYIDEAILSVRNQTFPRLGLVVLDDGSQDGTVARARRHERDGRVRVLTDGRNLGLVARLNQSIDLCATPFYARMDAEDVMHPERLARQYAALEAAPGAGFCATGACLIDESGALLGLRGGQRPGPYTALTRGGIIHPTLLARTAFLRDNRYVDRYPRAEDRELFLRGRNFERGCYLDEPLLFYRYVRTAKTAAILAGYRSERRLMLRHGPALVGWPRAAAALAISMLKSAYVGVAGIDGSGLVRKLERDPGRLAACEQALRRALAPRGVDDGQA